MEFRARLAPQLAALGIVVLAGAALARPPSSSYATPARPVGRSVPASGLTAQAARVQQDIAKTPSVSLPVPPTLAGPGKAATPASATLLYRPLNAQLETEVREVLAKQLNWPANDPDKQRRIAVFPGAVQPAINGEPQMTLKAIAAEDAPFTFDPTRRLFEGRIQVGFVELGADGAERPLAGNFSFQVQGPVMADPPVARVTRTAPPFQVMRVTSNDPGDQVLLTVRSSVNPDGVQLTMNVVRPQVVLRVTPPSIQGFGLEVADIVVSSRAPAVTRGQTIQLSSDGGRIEPLTVAFDESGVAKAAIRSVSTGPVTVRAEGAVLGAAAQTTVNFLMPWSFLIAALLGGLTGGVLRKGTSWRTRRKRLAIELLVAVLTGAVVFGLFALGVNLLGVRLPAQGGEVLVFVVCALGAFVGTQLFGFATPAPGARRV